MYINKMNIKELGQYKKVLTEKIESAKKKVKKAEKELDTADPYGKETRLGLTPLQKAQRDLDKTTERAKKLEEMMGVVEKKIKKLKSETTQKEDSKKDGVDGQEEKEKIPKTRRFRADELDKKIINFLLADSSQSKLTLAQKLNVSDVAVAKRIKKLEENNIITGFTITIDYDKLKEKATMQNIYTIGYSNSEINVKKFIELLTENGINCLVDVRRNNFSYKKGFRGSELVSALKKANIKYSHLKELGTPDLIRKDFGRTGDLELLKKRFRKYLDLIKDIPENDFERLVDLCRDYVVCIMCSEEDPNDCHRSIIAEELEKKLFNVEHLMVVKGEG